MAPRQKTSDKMSVPLCPGKTQTYTPLTTQYGNVGVMTASPQFSLDVSGSARVTGSMTAAGNTLGVVSGKPYLYNAGIISNSGGAVTDVGSGNVGVVFTAPGVLDLVNANNTSMLRVSGANVGINNTTPQYTLDVSGGLGNVTSANTPSFNGVQCIGSPMKVLSGSLMTAQSAPSVVITITFPTAFNVAPAVSLTGFNGGNTTYTRVPNLCSTPTTTSFSFNMITPQVNGPTVSETSEFTYWTAIGY